MIQQEDIKKFEDDWIEKLKIHADPDDSEEWMDIEEWSDE
jgi:hypothetical protein